MALQVDETAAAAARAGQVWPDDSVDTALASHAAVHRISIFGLGYVGTVSLACLARDGHEMIGVDIDHGKLELLRAGQAPVVETGIQELMHAVMHGGSVRVSDCVREAILASDVSFICVGTPAQHNGSQNLDAITRIAQQIGAVLPEKPTRHVIVVRSTVRPGTVEDLIRPQIESSSGLEMGRDFSLCFQPEFLREGTSICDYDNPPLTVVGASDPFAVQTLREIFGHLPCEFVETSIRTAEMLKYACNAFHATKVSFANEIGRICQACAVDAHEVMKLLCMDRQLNISSAYLKPGFAFGGSCLPKDLKALLYLAKRCDLDLPLLASVLVSNTAHIEHTIEQVLATGRRSVGMIGLSFKAGTDDLRDSPLVTMAERFIGKGMKLCIFDPEVHVARLIGANRRFIEESIPHIASLMSVEVEQVVREAEVLIVAMKTPQVLAALEAHTRPGQLLLDLVALPHRAAGRASYRGVCW